MLGATEREGAVATIGRLTRLDDAPRLEPLVDLAIEVLHPLDPDTEWWTE